MKPYTRIWLQCESVGRPETAIRKQVTVREATLEIATWLLDVYMGSKIRITIGRNETDLSSDRRSADVADILGDLESLIPASEEESDGHS
jgi:hypothetical protein